MFSLWFHVIPESVGGSNLSVMSINTFLVMHRDGGISCSLVEAQLVKKPYCLRPGKENLPREVEHS